MAWLSIKSIMPAAIRKAGITQEVTAVRVLETAARILASLWGEERGALVAFVAWNNGTLKAQTASPAAKQTLSKQKTQFLNDINHDLGEKSVLDLDIRSQGF